MKEEDGGRASRKGDDDRDEESEKGRKTVRERARKVGMVHADTREITAFAYVWIHRSSERASASGRPGFIGLLQARRGMAARWREREKTSEKRRDGRRCGEGREGQRPPVRV